MDMVSSSSRYRTLLVLGGVLLLAAQVVDAQEQVFEWGFTGDGAVSTSLPACSTLALEADARAANGTPPYYMTAFAVHGTPLTSFVGTDENNLSWTVRHPVGAQLVLGVVDSKGISGGIDSPLYTVVEGSSSDCIPATSSESSFTITANVTDELSTCQPWGLTMQGGTPPYTITIAPMNGANVTNSTLRTADTWYTWINRATPGSHLIAAASDSKGRWATGDAFVVTKGSQDTDCAGLVTTSGSGSAGTAPTQHSNSHKHIGIIVGATLGGVLLVGALIFAVVFRRRLMHRQRQTSPEIDPFFNPPSSVMARNASSAPLVISGDSKSRTATASTGRSEFEAGSSSSPCGSPMASPGGSTVPLPPMHEQHIPNLPPPPYPKFFAHDAS
ncbi:hypothetical protein FB45DRAFT_1053576 [Roridomyces roridus]|uniref:Uncharacterized protein n=1 Tax=Roridomyces roridus TaxID=1738132 RepID=A0AAD7CCS5_9AGAR|nr:hypothetical protein FB45DRAFT_1053576 [Roridomyces roridus]